MTTHAPTRLLPHLLPPFKCYLEQTGKHDVALPLVLVAKLGTVGALLALGPDVHLRGADGDEEGDGPAPARQYHARPREDLIHVVGAGHDGEAVAVGDLPLGAAGAAQRREVAVHEGVAGLAEEVEGGAEGVEGGRVGRGRERRGPVNLRRAQQARDGPVEEAVLEDVGPGHGAGRELVHEERLELALDEVRHDHAEREPLRLGQLRGRVGEDVGAGGDDGRVDEEGAEVLDDEDGPPGDLVACISMLASDTKHQISNTPPSRMPRRRTQVLDEDLASRNDALRINDASLAVLQRFLGGWVVDTDPVVVAEARGLGDDLLDILDGQVIRDLDQLREVPDRLLGS